MTSAFASEDEPLIIIKLAPDVVSANVRALIAQAARESQPIRVVIPLGEIDADALMQVTKLAIDHGVELHIKGEVG